MPPLINCNPKRKALLLKHKLITLNLLVSKPAGMLAHCYAMPMPMPASIMLFINAY